MAYDRCLKFDEEKVMEDYLPLFKFLNTKQSATFPAFASTDAYLREMADTDPQFVKAKGLNHFKNLTSTYKQFVRLGFMEQKGKAGKALLYRLTAKARETLASLE